MIADRNFHAKPLIVFSVYQAGRSDAENEADHLGALLALRRFGATYEQLEGCYKGVRERSIMVVDPSTLAYSFVHSIAEVHNQESILYVDATRSASLVYVDTERSPDDLGRLVCVPESEALGCDAWSKNAVGDFYVVR